MKPDILNNLFVNGTIVLAFIMVLLLFCMVSIFLMLMFNLMMDAIRKGTEKNGNQAVNNRDNPRPGRQE
jgi:hypothetical protein